MHDDAKLTVFILLFYDLLYFCPRQTFHDSTWKLWKLSSIYFPRIVILFCSSSALLILHFYRRLPRLPTTSSTVLWIHPCTSTMHSQPSLTRTSTPVNCSFFLLICYSTATILCIPTITKLLLFCAPLQLFCAFQPSFNCTRTSTSVYCSVHSCSSAAQLRLLFCAFQPTITQVYATFLRLPINHHSTNRSIYFRPHMLIPHQLKTAWQW